LQLAVFRLGRSPAGVFFWRGSQCEIRLHGARRSNCGGDQNRRCRTADCWRAVTVQVGVHIKPEVSRRRR
jgi:hypothetical protein